MKSKNIELRVHDRRLVSEESEWVYKDIDEVIRVVEGAALAMPVSRNLPLVYTVGFCKLFIKYSIYLLYLKEVVACPKST